jgi:hypothetical protein
MNVKKKFSVKPSTNTNAQISRGKSARMFGKTCAMESGVALNGAFMRTARAIQLAG